MKEIIKNSLDGKDISPEKKKELLDILDEAIDQEAERIDPKILKKQIIDSFSFRDSKTYTSALELIAHEEDVNIFQEVLFDKLNNDELGVYYDDALIDNGAVFIAYRINDRMIFEHIYSEDDGRFAIDYLMSTFTYPKSKKMNNDELTKFYDALKRYNETNDIFILDRKINKTFEEPDIDLIKRNRRLKFLGYFWSYEIIIAPFILLFISYCLSTRFEIPNINVLYVYSVTIPFSLMGLDYALSCIFKWPHILLVDQLKHKQRLDLDDLNWNNISKRSYIIFGFILFFAGIILPLLTIIF